MIALLIAPLKYYPRITQTSLKHLNIGKCVIWVIILLIQSKLSIRSVMELNQELIKDLLSRKKKGSKTEELKKYRELILELRNLGLSINDICIYLKREHKIKVSPATLKSAFPELTSRLKQFERIVKNMDDNELKKAYEIVRKEIASRNTSTT